MGFIIGILIFSIPATILAVKKGFAPLRWILSLGLIGLGFVVYLPSARAAGISSDEAQKRAVRANKIGAQLAWINLGINVISITYSMWAMISNGVWQFAAVPMILLGITYVAAERIIAFRWLIAESGGQKTNFWLWAFLTLLLPVVGIGLYLILRPKRQAVSAWSLPQSAVLPLATIAALVMAAFTSSASYYYFSLGIPVVPLVITMKIALAAVIGFSSWYFTSKKQGKWQNGPFFLLAGTLLAIITMFYRLMGFSASYGGLLLLILIFSLMLFCAMSALVRLVRFDVREMVRGLLLGYIAAMIILCGISNRFGVFSPDVVVAFIALPLAYIAFLSSKEIVAIDHRPEGSITFSNIAVPFWGLLIFQTVVGYAISAIMR